MAARPRFRFAVAIAVCCSRTRVRSVPRRSTGLVLLRSISFLALQVAYAVVAARLGFAGPMGCGVVDPLTGSFGNCPSRVGLAEETALSSWRPRFVNSLVGRSLPVHLCEVAPEGLGSFLAVGLAKNQYLDRPLIGSRFGVGLVADRRVGARVTRTNSVLLRSPRPSQVATSFTIFPWTASRSSSDAGPFQALVGLEFRSPLGPKIWRRRGARRDRDRYCLAG